MSHISLLQGWWIALVEASFTNTSTFTIRLPKERNTHTYEDTILTFNINLHLKASYESYIFASGMVDSAS